MRERIMQIWLDSDMGVDDALALAWLLSQADCELIGISTVFGNTTAQGAAANALTVLAAAQQQRFVVLGAEQPLEHAPYSTGFFAHGPDGLWGAQQAWDLSSLANDSAAALVQAYEENPDLTVLALGPLTNLAQALQRYPDELAGLHIVAMAGARYGGNETVVAESNTFIDPHALEYLLHQPIALELVLLDAVREYTWPAEQIDYLLSGFAPQLRELCQHIVPNFVQATGGQAHLADLCAAMYAVHPDLAETKPALVRVLVDGWGRGQTLIADTFEQRMPLILQPKQIMALLQEPEQFEQALQDALASQPDNAQYVLRFDWPRMLAKLVS
jgi:inosine-uridine nucleoside N-ribohydrolase